MKTPCQCCKRPTYEISKRFDPVMGFCCITCYDFLEYVDLVFASVGVDGVVLNPVRHSPKPETP